MTMYLTAAFLRGPRDAPHHVHRPASPARGAGALRGGPGRRRVLPAPAAAAPPARRRAGPIHIPIIATGTDLEREVDE